MTPHALNPCFERVVRAGEHLADLRHRLFAALRKQEDSIVCYFDPDPPHALKAAAPNFPLPPMRIGVLIGEVCYNLRSALDYLIFELFKLDSGKAQEFTQFPIVSSPDKFRSWAKDARSKGLNSPHIAELQSLQPYKGCNWTKILRDLSNMDKHRNSRISAEVSEQTLLPKAIRASTAFLALYVAHHIPCMVKCT